MASIVGSIIRAATRKPGEPLNILCCPTHERYESGLAKTEHNFYAIRTEGVKDWDRTYAPLPNNYTLLNPSRASNQVPPDLDFDLVLSQNKFGQYQILSQIAGKLQLPLVSLEHTLPHPSWDGRQKSELRELRGERNVFISNFSVGQWGWSPKDPTLRVIHHGIDTETFCPNEMLCDRKPLLLSVVNDWINRDWCCGYNLWKDVTKDLPVLAVGKTPGLSEPAKSIPDLVMKYRSSRVFLNTSLISPVPTALLEAMACGCAVVSTATAMIPEVITHGEDGFIANDPKELRSYCQMLLQDEELAGEVGRRARETVLAKFSMGAFVEKWNRVFEEVSGK